jgi:hypothetical protein
MENLNDIAERMAEREGSERKMEIAHAGAEKPSPNYGLWQLCPKCDGEGRLPGVHYDGLNLSTDRVCPVCNGAKILARPIINDEKV